MPIQAGPCLWPDTEPLCCSDWDSYSDALKEQAHTFATTMLWAATGRAYGLCELTVRPCGQYNSNWNNAGWYWDGYGTWVPYIFNGEWFNCYCGCNGSPGCCTCDPACQVYLPGPVHSIVSVQVDGASLPVSGANGNNYFVLDQQWLVRTDTSACWPLCSDQNLAPGATDAFEVTYLRGRAVPPALATAAGTLACEYAKACSNLPCRLPSRVTNVSRQGVSISMTDIQVLLDKGMTGIWEVDQVIAMYNPYGMKGRTRFYSPDLQEGRQITYP